MPKEQKRATTSKKDQNEQKEQKLTKRSRKEHILKKCPRRSWQNVFLTKHLLTFFHRLVHITSLSFLLRNLHICVSPCPHGRQWSAYILLAFCKTFFFFIFGRFPCTGVRIMHVGAPLCGFGELCQVAGKVGSLACSCSQHRHLLTLIWCCSTNLLPLDVAYLHLLSPIHLFLVLLS